MVTRRSPLSAAQGSTSMNIIQLDYLNTLVQLGNFQETANEHCVTTQAIRKSIKTLEQEIGKPLFEQRSNSSMIQLTPFGQHFVKQASETLRSFDRLKELAFAPLKDSEKASELRCAIIHWQNGESFYAQDLIDAYNKNHHEVTVSRWPNDICLQALTANIVDAAISLARVDQPAFVNNLLFTFTPVAIVNKGNPLSHRDAIDLQEPSTCVIAIPMSIDATYAKLFFCATQLNLHLQFVNVDHAEESYRRFLSTYDNACILTVNGRSLTSDLPGTTLLPLQGSEGIRIPVFFSYNKSKALAAEHLFQYIKNKPWQQ